MMRIVALEAASVAVALGFATAGAAKLVLPASLSMEAWGVPARWAPSARLLLPRGELLLAALVLVPLTARVGAALAVGALLAFTAALGRRLRTMQGPEPCSCFGRVSAPPMGRLAMARNVALATAASAVVLLGPPAVAPVVVVASSATVAVVVLTWVICQLSRELKDSRAIAGMGPAARVELPTVAGKPLRLADAIRGGRALLLVFVDPYCGPCQRLLPDVAAWQRAELRGAACVLVSEGSQASAEMAERFGLKTVALQENFSLARLYGARGTPAGVILRAGAPVTEVMLGAHRVREAAHALGLAAATGSEGPGPRRWSDVAVAG